jgi:septal ring factor EnvC (AmiA/AmiB activator)
MKEYPYQPDDKNIKLITKVLYEMVADPEKRKEMEIEEKSMRYIERVKKSASEPLKKTIEEQANTIKEKEKALEESKKTLEEKDKALEESKKTIEERDKENAELIEKYTKLERLLRDKQIE